MIANAIQGPPFIGGLEDAIICREPCASPRPSCRRNPIRQDDEFSPRRLSITENERRSRAFGATKLAWVRCLAVVRRRPRRCPGGHDVSDDLLVPRLRRR